MSSYDRKAFILKYGSLVSFCLQNTLAPIVFRYAMTETTEADRASTPAVLFITEMAKCVLAFLLLIIEESFSVSRACSVIYQDALMDKVRSLKLGVPAFIYALQNALLQISSGHLSGPVWHVTYQGKILAVALMSMLLLEKVLKRVQWFALLLMGAGIAVVELSNSKESKLEDMANAQEQNFQLGLFLVFCACVCSAFAGVFTEMLFKQIGSTEQKKISLWLQNCVMSAWSMLLAFAAFCLQQAADEDGPTDTSMLRGFTMKIWALVALNAAGGMLVAMAIKYADNILRGFSSAFATVNGALLSVFFFGFELRASFLLGMLMVLASALLYGGVLKLPGVFWDAEVHLCLSAKRDRKSATEEVKPSTVGSTETIPRKLNQKDIEQMKEEV